MPKDSDEVYEWHQRPSGVSWIRELNASRAIAQCQKWDLTPADTLEANRALLRDYLLSKLGVGALTPTPVTDTIPVLTAKQSPTPNPASEPQQWNDIVQATAQAVGQQIAAALATPVTSDTPNATLPHVIRDITSKSPVCTGSDAQILLSFLKVVRQIQKLNIVSNKQILLSLLSKTAGQLRTIWTDAFLQNTDVTTLIQNIVLTFLPDRAKQQLLARSVYRVQSPTESLADFILDVKEAAEILLPPDHDILDVILTGMNQSNRARLAGFPPPNHITDLLALIPRMEVIRQLEIQSTQQSHNRSNNSQPPNAHFNRPQNSNDRPYQSYRPVPTPPRFPYRPSFTHSNYRPPYNNSQSFPHSHRPNAPRQHFSGPRPTFHRPQTPSNHTPNDRQQTNHLNARRGRP